MNTLNQRDQNSQLMQNTPQKYGHFMDQAPIASNADLAQAFIEERYSNDYKCYHWLLVFFIICDLAFVMNLVIRLNSANLQIVVGLILNGVQLLILAYAMYAKNKLEFDLIAKADRLLNGTLYLVIFYYAFLIFGIVLDGGIEVALRIIPLLTIFLIHFILMFYFYKTNGDLMKSLYHDSMIRLGQTPPTLTFK